VREPLLLPLAAFAAGILIAKMSPFGALECALAAAAFTALAIIEHVRGAALIRGAAAALALVMSGTLAAVLHQPGPPPEIDATAQETVILSGCVVEPTVFTEDRDRFTLELAPGARVNVSFWLREGEKPPRLEYGQLVEFDGKIRKVHNFENPGAFDYVRYLARRQVYWTASARASAPIRILPGRCGSRLLAGLFALRTAALDRLEKLYAGDPHAVALTEAILLGESTKLEKVWTEDFRRTGTYHALVISGLHVTVLAGVLLFCLRLCALGELTSLLVATLAAWLYAGVSGWSAPVIRAAGGFTLYIVARYFYRRGRVLNLLAAIAFGYLVWDPGQLFDASFQLSFLAVAAIGAFAVPVLDATSGGYRAAPRALAEPRRDLRLTPRAAELRVEMRLIAETIALWTPVPQRLSLAILGAGLRFALWAFEMVAISAVIQIALALPMALYFHRISITGLSANLIIVPVMSAAVPLGFIAIFTGWAPVAQLVALLLRVASAVANWHVHFEPSRRIPDPPLWLDIALIAALVAAAIAMRLKTWWRWPAAGAVAAAFATLLISPFPPELERGRLEMTAVDVGQGDGILIALPDGKLMLVDSGGIPQYGRRSKPKLDIGEDVISPYLWTRRIQKVDILALSHGHEDHIGGAAALIANFRPNEIWTGARTDCAIWNVVLENARREGARVRERRAGEHFVVGGAAVDILAPTADYIPGDSPGNNDSLAFRISYGEHSFLLTGDIEWPVESRLAADGVLTRTTVLKTPHHGSKTSSTNAFLDALQPAVAVVSAGYQNMFHHPHAAVLERFAEHHTSVLRTDLDGLITISTDGRRLAIHTMRGDYSMGGSGAGFIPWPQ
jgi:competence protein ComEC